MSADYSTRTEQDAGTSARLNAYDDRDLPTRADLAEEAAWWDWWWREGRFQEADPHGWPREAEGSLLQALRTAEAAVTCQGCGQRGHENACDHGKNICPECWPDKCWGCQADASDAESTW